MQPGEVVRSVYDAFTRGDSETMVGFMDADIMWHVEAPGPLAGTHRGREAVHELLVERFGPALEGTRAEVQDMLVEDEGRVTVRVRFVAASDEGVTFNSVHIFRVEDDQIVEMWFHPMTDQSVERFWDGLTGGTPG